MTDEESTLWFGKNANGAFVPLTWQGKFASILYVVLVLLAFLVYSNIGLIIFVILVYTAIMGFLVVFKSDLKDKIGPGDS